MILFSFHTTFYAYVVSNRNFYVDPSGFHGLLAFPFPHYFVSSSIFCEVA